MIFSPFYTLVFTLTIFIESGCMPVLSDWFIITLRGSLISCLIAFSSLFDISSTPELFLFFNLFIIVNISFSVVILKLKFKLVGCVRLSVNFDESLSTTILLDKSEPTLGGGL